ncbi:expressed unknown protein [Seminavis robusta]|uniref:BTB domain-containing protein n=1 Tax=Seminavis robusta TaxID=568900 RepID=A0A9N8EJM3_9STRA|nr:expressed unknown protein [Seminavis robusta]|eukprot:Sro1106_g242000.1 n/a (360) ;mRNA; r:14971-16050
MMKAEECWADSDDEPATKRLRCTDPDLKIVLEYSTREESVWVEMKKEYHMYSHVLAGLSNFIDTSLSVDMKEKKRKEIVFKDVTPEIFEMALKYQQDLGAVRFMEAKDAAKLIKFYDKYEFTGGIKLCDDVLSDYFQNNIQNLDLQKPPEDLDLLVRAAALAYRFDLTNSKDAGIQYLKTRMHFTISPFGLSMFSEDHIKRLQPMFVEGVFRQVHCALDALSAKEVAPLSFPKYFISLASDVTCGQTCRFVELSGTGTYADGTYSLTFDGNFKRQRKDDWDGEPCDFFIERGIITGENWGIVAWNRDEPAKVIWKCPHTATLELPPEGPWFPVSEEVDETMEPKLLHLGGRAGKGSSAP